MFRAPLCIWYERRSEFYGNCAMTFDLGETKTKTVAFSRYRTVPAPQQPP
jgi:hypothetical protein